LSAKRFCICPESPFDFELNCKVFGFDKPMPEVFDGRVWRRAIRLESDKLTPVALQSVGSVDEPKIEVETLQTVTEKELVKKLDEIFSFSQNLTRLYAFMDNDPVLRDLKLRFMD